MKNENFKPSGFTLLEVMVVVAIISIMTVSVVIGFGSFGKTVQLQETASIIEDLIKKFELEITQNEYDKSQIEFEKDFILVKSQKGNSDLEINYKGAGVDGCKENEATLEFLKGEEMVYLNKMGIKGNKLEIRPLKSDEISCIAFKGSKEIGLQFQTYFKDYRSDAVRLFHFNINRSDPANHVEILSGTDYSLNIQGPYGKKQYYKDGIGENKSITLTLKNTEGDTEEITLN